MNLNISLTLGRFLLISLCLNLLFISLASAQQSSIKSLPGNGLAQHDFMYAGEGKIHNIYIVKNGKIDWSYTNLQSKGEISDAVLLKNGNILFAHQFGVSILTPSKKIIWNYAAPVGSEIHTAVSSC
ncbi:MAG: hypothetical protein H7Y07_16375 [Pyrinomonadaceae bacterium]|nr:hypothetical protein [Sphingobacteriaceae bacterium]